MSKTDFNLLSVQIEVKLHLLMIELLFTGQEPHIFERYCQEVYKLEKIVIKKMSFRGLVNSTGQCIPFFGYALALYYGGTMVANEGVHFKNIIK